MRTSTWLFLLGFLTVSARESMGWDAPYYRVFRGYRKGSVAVSEFQEAMAKTFIPAAPATHQKNGLIAYLPSLSPQGLAGVPDEFAIVVYESKDAYEKARQTPEGQSYGALHWKYFEEPANAQTGPAPDRRTRSDTAVPFARELAMGRPVDVLNHYVDWQAGYANTFIGMRKAGVSDPDFLKAMTEHVTAVREAFTPMGLDGYIAVVHEEPFSKSLMEIAYLHWKSEQAANAAFSSPIGQQLNQEGQKVMQAVMFSPAASFAGTIAPGQSVNVHFTPRPRP
jgi:quinol monooxygenase YgiN